MAIYGKPPIQILDDQTDRIGIRTVVLGMIWQPSRWPMSLAELEGEKPGVPAMPSGVEFYGEQTRHFGGCLRTTWTFRGVSGSGKDVTFKTRGNSIDYKFEPGFAQVSLLLHPQIQAMLAAYGGAVQDGQIVWPPTVGGGSGSASGARSGSSGGKANPLFGEQDYFRLEGTYTYRYVAVSLTGLDAGVGQAHPASYLPGEAKSYANRDYLKLPLIYQRVGPVHDVTETYWLSGEGGWPQPIYGGTIGGASRAAAAADGLTTGSLTTGNLGPGLPAAGVSVSASASADVSGLAAPGSDYSKWEVPYQAAVKAGTALGAAIGANALTGGLGAAIPNRDLV